MVDINKNKDNWEWKLLVMILKEIADAKGITQQSIADNTGLLKSNVSRFFALKYTPTLDTFLKIAKAINVNFFFEDKDAKTDLSIVFEKAMAELGRKSESFNKN